MSTPLKNPTMKAYAFLAPMYADKYFPAHCVDKGKAILVGLCTKIEQHTDLDDAGMYALTHAATEAFNDLQEDFEDNDSEIETGAREAIAADFEAILKAYGFAHLDLEEAIATREW